MSELQLIKSAKFGEIQADIYSRNDEPYMTTEQLGACLGFANGRKGIDNIIKRNPDLKKQEFSVTLKMRATDGKQYNTRIFTEDGIYEVTMLAKTEKAKEFRAWVRKLLKSLRKGDAKLVSMTEYQQMMMQTRAENAKIRKAQILTRLANQYDGTYKQVLNAHATKELTGEYLLPLPQLPDKTYSASELGAMLGVSANKIGTLANRHNLKTEQYGSWFNDKAKHCNKEVQSFRYYPSVIPIIREFIEQYT